MELSADRLQQITHAFCYNYARATKGVSYCGPAYYADHLCDRGRAYLRGWLTDGDAFNAGRDRDADETADDFHDFVKDYLYADPYYRPNAATPSPYGERERANPWHPNLDNTMFYL
ncbi:hypothetical protein LTR36_010508 [Oleoguttula mirabilis]|uniref:Uncharacterized protein n=1 Tax=Oleoguttula mirabilis TaxID=1507867 RepID=A0AAV9J3Y1_9PEZI|nr:hypothetical protein LTR36_010508 [Oleoguttula mirabilis]